MQEYGSINIKLKELLKERGLSKNKFSHRAEMQRTQINNYCNKQTIIKNRIEQHSKTYAQVKY